MKTLCFICEIKEATMRHHIVPQVIEYKYNKLIDVCDDCHWAIHQTAKNGNHKELTKLGLLRAKEKGVILGRRKGSKDLKKRKTGVYFEREKKKKLNKQFRKQEDFWILANRISIGFHNKYTANELRQGHLCKRFEDALARVYLQTSQTFLD